MKHIENVRKYIKVCTDELTERGSTASLCELPTSPEAFQNSMNDMTWVDLLEMLCDWKASTLRHSNGNLLESIEVNRQRFGYDD